MLWIGFTRNQAMLEINLLPWRTTLRERNERLRRWVLIFVITLSIIICSLIHIMMNYFSHKTQMNIQRLQNHLAQTDNKRSSDVDLQINQLIKQIRLTQTELLTFFNAISIAQGITWQSIESQNGPVLLTGKADAFKTLLWFIGQYNSAKHFQVKVMSITNIAYSSALAFRLQSSRAQTLLNLGEK